jgi:2-oxoglutarate ferredoxin oxidoreductase subunit delta
MAKGHIVINETLCKGCEFCAMVCPQELIAAADYFNAKGYHPALFTDLDNRCTGCTLCAMICPDAVITVYRAVKAKPVVV